jgi:hypothetical protein
VPPVGFEPTISAGERPKTYALERAGTGTGWREKVPKLILLQALTKRFYIEEIMTATLLAVRVNSRKHLQVFILLTAKMTNRTSYRGFYAVSDLITLIHTP